jgi:hypothetical protein
MLREAKDTPNQIINNGEFQTGTFKDYFRDLNITEYNHRNLINRETLWQAVEIDHPKYFIICAVYKYQLFHKSLFLVYDKETYELHDYSSEGVFHKSYVSKSLINGETSSRTTKESKIEIINYLDQNRIILKASYKDEFSLEANLVRKASPSVVSVPMSRKHVVYTEKDYFHCTGTMRFGDIEINLDKGVFAVLDDHRGFYPLNSGYDWVSGFGKIKFLQENTHVVLNLTDFHRN